MDVDTNFAFAHYEVGLAAQRAFDRGRKDGLEAALAEYGAALQIVAEYFEKAEEYDRMFVMLQRPREYRGEEMRMLEAKIRWRMAEVYERVGMTEEAREERGLALRTWPAVEEAIAGEEDRGR